MKPKLYYKDDIQNITSAQLESIILELPEWRREKVLKFKHEAGRRESALAYIILRDALINDFGIAEPLTFVYGNHGKPSLKEHPEVYFSISHCKNVVAVAISDTPIGVDVEMMDRWNESVAKYTMNDDEMQSIMDADDRSQAFIQLWTKKEAVLKMAGTGITDDIKTVLIDTHGVTIDTTINNKKRYAISMAY